MGSGSTESCNARAVATDSRPPPPQLLSTQQTPNSIGTLSSCQVFATRQVESGRVNASGGGRHGTDSVIDKVSSYSQRVVLTLQIPWTRVADAMAMCRAWRTRAAGGGQLRRRDAVDRHGHRQWRCRGHRGASVSAEASARGEKEP